MSQRVYRRQRLAFRGSSAPDFLPERQVFVGYGCVQLENDAPSHHRAEEADANFRERGFGRQYRDPGES